MTPETRLKNEIKIYCGKRNWLCYHCLNGTFYSHDGTMVKLDFPVGFPDLLIIRDDGKVMFIETKVRPYKPTPEQLKFQENLRGRGFISEIVYDLDSFISLI